MSESKAFKAFVAEKIPILRRYHPLASADENVLINILEKAYKGLADDVKAYYEKKASHGTNVDAEAIERLSAGDKREAYSAYLNEMYHINSQHNMFVKYSYNQITDLFKRVWTVLTDKQRFVYYERTVLKYAKRREEIEKNIQLINSKKSYWDTHAYNFLTNDTDSLAFCVYANTVQANHATSCPTSTELWKQWMALDNDEKQKYYKVVPKHYAYYNAKKEYAKLFRRRRIQVSAEDLERGWRELSTGDQMLWVNQAFIDYHQRSNIISKIGKYNNPEDVFNITTIDDDDAKLTPIPPYNHIHKYNQESAFIVYMEMMRPEMDQDNNYYWAVNKRLIDQWIDLTSEEKRKYYNIVRQYLGIKSELDEWQLNAEDVYARETGKEFDSWHNKAEKKEQCEEIADQNRKILLKKYPNLYTYFAWTLTLEVVRCRFQKPVLPRKKKSKSAANASKSEVPKVDYTIYTDKTDDDAFMRFVRKAKAMTDDRLDCNDIWEDFVNLSEQDRNAFYDEVVFEKALRNARKQFAQDNCSIVPSYKDDKYIQELRILRQKWDDLSPLAKQFYIDQEKEKLLKCEPKKTNHCDTLSVPINSMTYIISKYYSQMNSTMTEEQKLLRVYIKKELSQLSKEPGMAEKRHFQLCLILEERFKRLSAEERQPYADIVQRIEEMKPKTTIFKYSPQFIYYNEHGYSKLYANRSLAEREKCELTAKLNRENLLEEFPDLDDYFCWEVFDVPAKQHTSKSATRAAKSSKQKCGAEAELAGKTVQITTGAKESDASSNDTNYLQGNFEPEVLKTLKIEVAKENAIGNDEKHADTSAETSNAGEPTRNEEAAITELSESFDTWELVDDEETSSQ